MCSTDTMGVINRTCLVNSSTSEGYGRLYLQHGLTNKLVQHCLVKFRSNPTPITLTPAVSVAFFQRKTAGSQGQPRPIRQWFCTS